MVDLSIFKHWNSYESRGTLLYFFFWALTRGSSGAGIVCATKPGEGMEQPWFVRVPSEAAGSLGRCSYFGVHGSFNGER